MLCCRTLIDQASSQASTWLRNVFPGGDAQSNTTWHTMMRSRLLLPAPGAPSLPPFSECTCRRTRRNGQSCGHRLDNGGAHEYVCPVAGLQDARRTRIRRWVAEKIRECWRCRVDEEEDVAPPLVTSAGRMDVVAKRHGQKLLADIVVGTIATDTPDERARRINEPGRSLRTASARKLTCYGPKVLAIAAEDRTPWLRHCAPSQGAGCRTCRGSIC